MYECESKILSLSDQKTSIITKQEQMNEALLEKNKVLAKPSELTQ